MIHIKKIVFVAFAAVALVGCSSDTTSTESAKEFVADSSSFASFMSWSQTVPPRRGADPAGLIGTAHGADDTSMVRSIYGNPSGTVRNANGQFPTGTMFVKDLTMNGMSAMVTGMAKRGGTYNPTGNGWEYFMIINGSIVGRGDTLMGGMCMGCHTGAGVGKDYIFTK